MSTDKMREEFEAWYLKRFGNCDMQSGWAMERWEAWQASRAALVIELPEERTARGYGEQVADALGFNDGISYCREAIETAGVKVAP